MESAFYRPMQEFILTMVEGTNVTSEKDYEKLQVDTSHITFILAGAFSEHSPDEFIPELKGRLNVKVRVRKLKFKDYLRIAELQKFDIPEILKDKLVVVESDAMVEIAKVCEELNEREYLGARRLKEIVSKVNLAIKRELQNSSSFPITVNANFIRWAVSFVSHNEAISPISLKGIQDTTPSKKIPKIKIKNQIRDTLIKELVSHYEKLLTNFNGTLEISLIFPFSKKHLLKKDSKGRTVLEYLVEKGAVKRITKSALESFKRRLGKNFIEKSQRKLR